MHQRHIQNYLINNAVDIKAQEPDKTELLRQLCKYGVAVIKVDDNSENQAETKFEKLKEKLFTITKKYGPETKKMQKLASDPAYQRNGEALSFMPPIEDRRRSVILHNRHFNDSISVKKKENIELDFKPVEKQVISEMFKLIEDIGLKVLNYLNDLPSINGSLTHTIESFKNSEQTRLGTNYLSKTKNYQSNAAAEIQAYEDLIKPHNDYDALTIVSQDFDSDGYYFEYQGERIPLKLPRNHLLVQIGEQMQIISKDLIPATKHGVIDTASDKDITDRVSIALFMHPSINNKLDSITMNDERKESKLLTAFKEAIKSSTEISSHEYSRFRKLVRRLRTMELTDLEVYKKDFLIKMIADYDRADLSDKVSVDLREKLSA